MKTLTPTLVLIAISVFSAANADAAGSVTYGRKRVSLSPSFQNPMQCVLNELQRQGYNPRDVGCFGYRPNNRSAHPTGHACDVDQTGRNITSLNRRFNSRTQIQIGTTCNAVSGCKWRSPDCGHYEARSAPYSPAGTRVGGGNRSHRYQGYEARPVSKKRRGRRR